METGTETHNPSPQVSIQLNFTIPQDQKDLIKRLNEILERSEGEQIACFSLLRSIAEVHGHKPECLGGIWAFVQIVDRGTVSTIDDLKSYMPEKTLTNDVLARSSEIETSFRN